MIIGISGKKQVGKDTVAGIIQKLTTPERKPDENGLISREILVSPWRIVRFADKLKDIVCLLTGCTREQLEDENFKNSYLSNSWTSSYDDVYYGQIKKEKYTYRDVLQIVGTDLFRTQFHTDTWVNATMVDYKSKFAESDGFIHTELSNGGELLWHDHPVFEPSHFPDWIIPDVRFPNEVQAIKQVGGIIIRIERSIEHMCQVKLQEKFPNLKHYDVFNEDVMKDLEKFRNDSHPSEIALDDYNQWDYVINNDGTLIDLEQKVSKILKHEST